MSGQPSTQSGNSIFISYRREDTQDVTGRIYDRLVQVFGQKRIFKDVDNIPIGVDFRSHLEQQVASCRALLAIVGPQWTQNPRLQEEGDFVRIEIEHGLDPNRNILVAPVLVGNATMPSTGQLPPSLKEFAFRNAIQVRPDPDFHKDMDRLIDSLKGVVGAEDPHIKYLKDFGVEMDWKLAEQLIKDNSWETITPMWKKARLSHHPQLERPEYSHFYQTLYSQRPAHLDVVGMLAVISELKKHAQIEQAPESTSQGGASTISTDTTARISPEETGSRRSNGLIEKDTQLPTIEPTPEGNVPLYTRKSDDTKAVISASVEPVSQSEQIHMAQGLFRSAVGDVVKADNFLAASEDKKNQDIDLNKKWQEAWRQAGQTLGIVGSSFTPPQTVKKLELGDQIGSGNELLREEEISTEAVGTIVRVEPKRKRAGRKVLIVAAVILGLLALWAVFGLGGEKPTFVNTLGMPFIPVPMTQVQFCIWETRVKDYAAYMAANPRVNAVSRSRLNQTGSHPVVNVSWNDAQAFCAWLTKKELAEGKLKPGQHYRLPTDVEWTSAVGLDNDYPWGNAPPVSVTINKNFTSRQPVTTLAPPKKSGNYGKSLNVDNFDSTSPVGSFAANEHGLYDLGGNVWEWCEDGQTYGRTSTTYRVLRGGSWADTNPASFSSLYQRQGRPDYRTSSYGFRCVLAEGSDPFASKPAADQGRQKQAVKKPEIPRGDPETKAGTSILAEGSGQKPELKKPNTTGQTKNKQPASKALPSPASITPITLKTGLAAYYPFGGDASDKSGNDHHGTVKGATLTTDRHGTPKSAYLFGDGGVSSPYADYNERHGGDYINTGKKPGLNGNAASLSLWVRIDKFPHEFSAGNNHADFIIRNSSLINFLINKYSTNPINLTSSWWNGSTWARPSLLYPANNLSLGQWNHIVTTLNAGTRKLYVNGVQVDSAINENFNLPPVRHDTVFGAYFNGALDDIRIYNRALSDKEVKALYDLEKPKIK